MTINERVSPERLAHIRASYEASRKGYAFIGHPSYNESIAIIDELQQYRAAAEPVYQYQAFTFVENSDGEQEKFWFWADCDERFYTACKGTKRILYAAPQVTSVPDDAFERALSVLNDTLDDCGDSERGLLLALDRMGIEVAGAAPAVRAEQLSGITEQVSQPALPEGYAQVPSKLTADNGAKGLLSGEFSETKYINCPECFGDDECETCDGSGRIEITVSVSWTTIKEIWAKGVEHFAAAPQQEAQEVKK